MTENNTGLQTGIGCGLALSVPAVALWGLYALATTVIDEAVANHSATIRAQADAALQYATVRQMDAVTVAMQAQVAQGRALPWLMGVVLILVCILLAWSMLEQYQLRQMVWRTAVRLNDQEAPDVA